LAQRNAGFAAKAPHQRAGRHVQAFGPCLDAAAVIGAGQQPHGQFAQAAFAGHRQGVGALLAQAQFGQQDVEQPLAVGGR